MTSPYLQTMRAHQNPDLHQTLSHRIRDTLVRQIVAGELEPGERLVETRVAATFGTSQAPVREALRELETFGLVEIKPRRGTFVRSFIRETLRESYVLRAALEETATRLVLMIGNVPFDELRDDVERMQKAARENDTEAVGMESVMFHRHIIEAAGNDLIKRTWENLHIEARTSVTIMARTPDLRAIADDHQALLDSLSSGDVDAACALARQHQWNYSELPDDTSTD
ncbi:GntR family transcriptional regulator [Mycolicibacterium mageritense]|uniref:GntR family transcriptional regulator n=2 Tax=Mycobacteriaceae TaxID=1762 RepID=A0ABM7I5Z4_MYCME|nr:GntR family transcriptional regulator [Mycolicibacterium mageritense]CDO26920.1 transcriptional regulator [Mycolicibacterium mageritense DSM 44476 = CIP 104973]